MTEDTVHKLSKRAPITSDLQEEKGLRKFLNPQRPYIWLVPILTILFAMALFPLPYAIWLSVMELDPVKHVWKFVGATNWIKIFNDPRAINSLIVTAKYVLGCVVIELLLGLGLALLLYKPGSRYFAVFRTLIIMPMMMTMVIVGLIFQLMYHSEWGVISYYLYKLGIVSPKEPLLGGTGKWALPAVISADVWQWTPFIFIIIYAGLQGLPKTPILAARVDGASSWQTFRYVTFPLLRPVIGIAFLIRLADLIARSFDYIYVMTYGGPVGGVTEVYVFYVFKQAFGFAKWGYGAALSVFLLLLIIILFNIIVKVFKIKF